MTMVLSSIFKNINKKNLIVSIIVPFNSKNIHNNYGCINFIVEKSIFNNTPEKICKILEKKNKKMSC